LEESSLCGGGNGNANPIFVVTWTGVGQVAKG